MHVSPVCGSRDDEEIPWPGRSDSKNGLMICGTVLALDVDVLREVCRSSPVRNPVPVSETGSYLYVESTVIAANRGAPVVCERVVGLKDEMMA